jgi:hypothetical protein
MTRVLPHDGLARTLDMRSRRHSERGLVPPPRPSSSLSGSGSGHGPSPPVAPSSSASMKPCATATMLHTLTMGLAAIREPRMVRERFEEELRTLVRATSVTLRHDEDATSRPNVISFDLPGSPVEGRPRLEAVFDPARPVDERAHRMLAAAAQVAGLLLEIERANGRWPLACARSRADGAAPLIGSSRAIRLVRDRIERVAATDFTVLIEGGIGSQPHPSFIEIFSDVALDDRDGAVERAAAARSGQHADRFLSRDFMGKQPTVSKSWLNFAYAVPHKHRISLLDLRPHLALGRSPRCRRWTESGKPPLSAIRASTQPD